MDSTSVLAGMLGGLALGAAGGYLLARIAGSGRGATERAERDHAFRQVADLQREIESLRTRLDEARRAAADASARLAERDRALEELKQAQQQAREALRDAFQSTGSEVLKAASAQLMEAARRQFEDQRKLTEQQIAERHKQIDATLAPFKEQLVRQEELVKQLDLKREGDAKALGEQLRVIGELQQQASTAAQSLAGALRDNRQRGPWGETSLRNVVEMSGMAAHVDFTEQDSVEGEEGRLRPDMVIHLPGGRLIPIDAKVPLSAYFDSLETARPDADRARRRQDHAQALRTHIRALASRGYAKALGADVEVTVLFVPVASALHAALEADPALHQEALAAGVIVADAALLFPLLKVCALNWQQAALAENAQRIGASATELLDRIEKFAEHLQSVGKGLESATRHFNQAVGSFNTRLLPGARATAELAHRGEALPEELRAVESTTRSDVAGAPGRLPG